MERSQFQARAVVIYLHTQPRQGGVEGVSRSDLVIGKVSIIVYKIHPGYANRAFQWAGFKLRLDLILPEGKGAPMLRWEQLG